MRSPDRLRPALVRGARAVFWCHANGNLILVHPNGLDETSVPVSHLPDAESMEEHYRRLADKRWVAPAAIDELREIAAGART